MKRKILIPSVGLVMLLVFGVAGARADMVNPFGLGALGAGLGYIAGGNARSAAIGGAAGMGAGIILNAAQGPRYGYYDRGYGYYDRGPRYVAPVYVGPGYYRGPGYYGARGHWGPPRHCYSGYCGPRHGYGPGPRHWR